VLCHERSTEVIGRLEAAGVTVIAVPGSELASSRGGPRCMACPVSRDPAVEGADGEDEPSGGEEEFLTARPSLPAASVTAMSPALDPELAPA
jgi:hypothetical protein